MTKKLPQAVQRQIDEAEALSRQMYGDPEGEAGEANDSEATREAEPASDTQGSESAPEAKADAPPSEPQEPSAKSTDVKKEIADKPADSGDAPEKWEARYRSLDGKYKTEVPALHAQVRELTAFVNQLRESMDKQNATKESKPTLPEVTAEDEEMFGADVVDLARRVAQREIAQHMQAMESEAASIKADVSRVQERVTETDYERFLDKVARAVPDMEQINRSEPWLQWLAQYDPLFGTTRQKALESAAHGRDVDRTAALFQAFLATQSPPPASAPAAPAAPQRNTAVEDASIVPRSQGTSPAAVASGSKRFFTEAEVTQLLDPRHLSKLPAEKARQIEREIDMASAEGRIL